MTTEATKVEGDRLTCRSESETPLETAARLRARLGIELTDQARKPLDRSVYDRLSDED